MDRKTRFFCTCREFEREVDTPCTMRDAKFAQRVAVERFNEHIENLGKADKDIVSEAVIVSEVRRVDDDKPVFKEVTFLSKNSKMIYESTPTGTNGKPFNFGWEPPRTEEQKRTDAIREELLFKEIRRHGWRF